MTTHEARAAIASYTGWYHRIGVAPGVVTPGSNDCGTILELLGLPTDLRGKRVLDVGTRDGFFAFECERRGADVLAIDYLPAEATGFAIASALLDSQVRYVQANVYHVTPEAFGTFDIVLLLGVLYHLREPLAALDLLRAVCTEQIYVETHVADEQLAALDERLCGIPLMQFCPGASLNVDPTNFWAPNTSCVVNLLQEAAFETDEPVRVGNRSIVRARPVVTDEERRYYRRIARGDQLPQR